VQKGNCQVQPELYFQLITPTLFLGVACMFAIIARKNAQYAEAKLFAASYFFGALGFLGDFFRLVLPLETTALLINTFYFLTTTCFTLALTRRSGLGMPVFIFWVAAPLYFACHIFFSFIYVDLWLLTTSLSIIHGGLFALGFAITWPRLTNRMDTALKWMGAAFSARFFIQPVLVKLSDTFPETYEAYTQSSFLLITLLIIGINASGVAFTLIADYTLKILRSLELDAHTDKLSGLLNRRGLESAVTNMFARSQDTSEAVFALMIDIDHFKKLNDTHGHAFGDEVIRQLGRLFNHNFAKNAVSARLGGEEFVTLFAEKNMGAALETAEDLRRSIGALCLYSAKGPVSFTVSLGLARHVAGEPLHDLLRRADAALYRAKDTGRNRVCSEIDISIETLRGISGAGHRESASARAR